MFLCWKLYKWCTGLHIKIQLILLYILRLNKSVIMVHDVELTSVWRWTLQVWLHIVVHQSYKTTIIQYWVEGQYIFWWHIILSSDVIKHQPVLLLWKRFIHISIILRIFCKECHHYHTSPSGTAPTNVKQVT